VRANWHRANSASPRWTLAKSIQNIKIRRVDHNVNISVDYLMQIWYNQEGKCSLSGITMTWAERKGHNTATSISLDRIDPAMGYIEGNVRLLCHAVNAFRGEMTDMETLNMLKQWWEFAHG
jgi:hypothetical protein